MSDDEQVITKRRVTMTSAVAQPDGSVSTITATDFVLPEHLEAYAADARTRWQSVVVSDEPDAGPGGWGGDTAVPPAVAQSHLEQED